MSQNKSKYKKILQLSNITAHQKQILTGRHATLLKTVRTVKKQQEYDTEQLLEIWC